MSRDQAATRRVRPERTGGRFRKIMKRMLLGIGGLLMLALLLGNILFSSVAVASGAMENTIMAGDHVLVDHDRAIRRGELMVFLFPGACDEVRPAEPQYFLKRCAALPGDLMEIRDSRVFVNGGERATPPAAISSGHSPRPDDGLRTFPEALGYTRDNWGPMRVPKKGDILALNDSSFYTWRMFIRREGHQVERSGESILIDGRAATEYVVERDYCFGMGDNRDNSLDSRYCGFVPVDDIVGRVRLVYWSSDPRANGAVRWERIFKTVE